MNPTTHPDGLVYGPTPSGKSYLSMWDHRGRNRCKSRWAGDVPPPDEYRIFERADSDGHADATGHYWGVRSAAGSVLGTRGERLAKFPSNAVSAVPGTAFPSRPRTAVRANALRTTLWSS